MIDFNSIDILKFNKDELNTCPNCNNVDLVYDYNHEAQYGYEYGCNTCNYLVGLNYHGFFFNTQYPDKDLSCVIIWMNGVPYVDEIEVFDKNLSELSFKKDVPFSKENYKNIYDSYMKTKILR